MLIFQELTKKIESIWKNGDGVIVHQNLAFVTGDEAKFVKECMMAALTDETITLPPPFSAANGMKEEFGAVYLYKVLKILKLVSGYNFVIFLFLIIIISHCLNLCCIL